tara:strand:- start:210 stop:932 length:723 start_codon:yes stop_codon:yes gene_type:complete
VANDHDLERYSRQIILNEIGPEGQEKIKRVSILVVGAGGLGSSVIQYLSAAGVGKIGIVDDDKVELSNLNRQLIYRGNDLGKSKVDAAKDYISKLNPSTEIETYKTRIDENNLPDIIDDYDLIADCSDNIETRLCINDICIKYKKTWVMAAVGGFFGQIASFQSNKNNTSNSTYRDLMEHKIFDEAGCDNIGAIGSVVGAVGGIQATEIIKLIIGIKENLVNKILIFDFITFQSKTLKIN